MLRPRDPLPLLTALVLLGACGDPAHVDSEGEGTSLKLRIGFADGTRTLLARFVRLAP